MSTAVDSHNSLRSFPAIMQPLRFHPIVKRTLWGGDRLVAELGKPSVAGGRLGESWEVADLPGNVSVVDGGEHDGLSLQELIQFDAGAMLGTHADHDRFPLLVKFIDARLPLSIQVHPRHTIGPENRVEVQGKAELWIVVDAKPASRIGVGLKEGVTANDLSESLLRGEISECLHSYEVQAGDAVFLPPGTVHYLGAGLLIAEIQQPCDVTFRLHDWNRNDEHGNPRELHIEQALRSVDESIGPISLLSPQPTQDCGLPEILTDNDFFTVRRYQGPQQFQFIGNNRPHVLNVLGGSVAVHSSDNCDTLLAGDTILIPAGLDAVDIDMSDGAILIDSTVS